MSLDVSSSHWKRGGRCRPLRKQHGFVVAAAVWFLAGVIPTKVLAFLQPGPQINRRRQAGALRPYHSTTAAQYQVQHSQWDRLLHRRERSGSIPRVNEGGFHGVGVTLEQTSCRNPTRVTGLAIFSMSLFSRMRGGPSGQSGESDKNTASLNPQPVDDTGSAQQVFVLDSDYTTDDDDGSVVREDEVQPLCGSSADFHEQTERDDVSSPGSGGDAKEERKVEEVGKERRGLFTYDWENGKRVKWVASKRSRATVFQEEGRRKLRDYLALPPTEYSLLDPKMISRLSDDKFRMDCGTLNIVGAKVSPTLFMRVDVQPEESMANIMVERVELGGSEAVKSAAGTFNVTSSTVVSCAELEGARKNELELNIRAHIEIEMLVPNENFIHVGVLRRAGNFVMQRVVDIGLPQFTKFLSRDYQRWSSGDDDRSAAVTADGESLIDSGE